MLEAELHVYQTALDEVEKKIRELAMEGKEHIPAIHNIRFDSVLFNLELAPC